MSQEFKDTALFLLLGLPFTVICHKNGAIRKRSLNQRNLKMPALCFGVDRQHFENRALQNDAFTIII